MKRIRSFEAYYARLNLKRNRGRTAITILSLVMSITVFIALQSFVSLLNTAGSLEEAHLGDYSCLLYTSKREGKPFIIIFRRMRRKNFAGENSYMMHRRA